MSKRAGNYITMREVLKEVGVDAIRFMMISRNADKKIDFDLDIFLQKNKDNPVFYIQYAHARCMSIINIAKNKIKNVNLDKKNQLSLTNLNLDEEKLIIKQICSFFNVIALSAENYEPHRISNFLYDLAKIFHNYWSLEMLMKIKK